MGNELTGILAGTGAKMKGEVMEDCVRLRGAFTAEIPFEEIVASARGTLLVLATRGHVVELGAGARAQQLAARIRTPPSRLDRLGVVYGQSAAVAGPMDPPFRSELATRAVVAPGTPAAPVDLLFLAVEAVAQFGALPKLVPLLANGGRLWVVYPKQEPWGGAPLAAAAKIAALRESARCRFSPSHEAVGFVRR